MVNFSVCVFFKTFFGTSIARVRIEIQNILSFISKDA